MMPKYLFVFGTRPEAIKMLPVVKEFESHADECVTDVCVSGQHREMLHQVLDLFDVIPDYDFDIMKKNQNIAYVTAEITGRLYNLLLQHEYDCVFVHGDTSTALASGLAAFYAHVPLAHVEAGLRTYDLQAPWPEEMNRQLCDRISTYHFCPTKGNAENLERELIDKTHIVITGNTVIDALMQTSKFVTQNTTVSQEIKNLLQTCGYLPDSGKRMILITGHRRESFGDKFMHICKAIRHLALKYPDVDFVYPVHLNPNVQEPVNEVLAGMQNVFLMPPQDYGAFVWLMNHSYAILTDSGGIQEEAPSLNKPVFVMRDTTERPEALGSGAVKLVGTQMNVIIESISAILDSSLKYAAMQNKENPYGDGLASKRIYDYIRRKGHEQF